MKFYRIILMLPIGIIFFSLDSYAQVFISNSSPANGHVAIKTWKEIRDGGLEKQDLDYSCGSASVATILRVCKIITWPFMFNCVSMEEWELKRRFEHGM